MDYYFPAWRVIVGCYLSALVLLPCIFLPHDSDAVLELRIMLMLSTPFYSAIVMFSYFGKVLKVSWWKRPIYVLTFPFSYMLLTALAHTLMPGNQMEGFPRRVIFGLTGGLSVIFFICFIMAFVMVIRALRHVSQENYSNPDDFPQQYASRVIAIPVIMIAVCWTCAFIGTQLALSLCVLFQAVLSVIFLVGALSPHRARDIEKFESGEHPVEGSPMTLPRHESESEVALSSEKREEILYTLRRVMEKDQVFLDSHLTLASLSRSCGVNRTYLSRVMNDCLGGFFNYVNRCRLKYAEQLKQQHPEMSVDELAIASGFGSRQSFYNIRRNLGA